MTNNLHKQVQTRTFVFALFNASYTRTNVSVTQIPTLPLEKGIEPFIQLQMSTQYNTATRCSYADTFHTCQHITQRYGRYNQIIQRTAYEINFQMANNDATINVRYLPTHGMYAHLQYSSDTNPQLTELLNTSLDIPYKITFP